MLTCLGLFTSFPLGRNTARGRDTLKKVPAPKTSGRDFPEISIPKSLLGQHRYLYAVIAFQQFATKHTNIFGGKSLDAIAIIAVEVDSVT